MSDRGGSEPKRGQSVGASGMMRGMNSPEIKLAPSLPWYRAIVTRSDRGRRLRRRVLIGLALCTAMVWFGLRGKLSYFVEHHCYAQSDCDWRACSYGRALCVLPLDQPDNVAGTCKCRQPPAGCREPRLVSEDGFEWKCLGGMEIDGGRDGDGGP